MRPRLSLQHVIAAAVSCLNKSGLCSSPFYPHLCLFVALPLPPSSCCLGARVFSREKSRFFRAFHTVKATQPCRYPKATYLLKRSYDVAANCWGLQNMCSSLKSRRYLFSTSSYLFFYWVVAVYILFPSCTWSSSFHWHFSPWEPLMTWSWLFVDVSSIIWAASCWREIRLML